MLRTWPIWIVLAACSAPTVPPVGNRTVATAAAPPPGACPRMTHIDASVWQNIAFPQCPPEPFETELPICAGRACPQPCRVTRVNAGSPPSTVDVHYDAAGRWLATTETTSSAATELSREATYDGGRMQSYRRGTGSSGDTERLAYDHGRLAQATLSVDGNIRLSYVGGRVVRIDHRNGTIEVKYDASGRVATVLADTTVSYRYDETGLLVELIDQSLEESRYSYDARRRLVRVDSTLHQGDGSANLMTITYDGSDRVVQIVSDMTAIDDTVDRYTTTYDYCD